MIKLNISRRYKRWRHGRGFGIHSPFAFSFITQTLRERLPYYAFDRLEAQLHECRAQAPAVLSPRQLRLLFRVAVRLHPTEAVLLTEKNAPIVKDTLRAACPQIKFKNGLSGQQATGTPHPSQPVAVGVAQLVFISPEACPSQIPAAQNCVYIFTGPWRKHGPAATALWESLPCGMMFKNMRNTTVIVADPKLPHQSFEAKF